MKLKSIVISIAFIAYWFILLKGCVYFRMEHLSEDDLRWAHPEYKSKVATFKSNRGNTAYLGIVDTILENSRCPIYFSENQATTFNPKAGYKFRLKIKETSFDNYFYVRRFVDNAPLMVECLMNNTGTQLTDKKEPIDSSNPILKASKLIPQNYKIENITYSNCIVLDSTNTHKVSSIWSDDNIPEVVESVFQREWGLIAFSLEDGETYIRKF